MENYQQLLKIDPLKESPWATPLADAVPTTNLKSQ